MANDDRDEKGLKMSHRAMLRLLLLWNQVGEAYVKVNGEAPSFADLLESPLVQASVQDILAFSQELSKRVGGAAEVRDYLNRHADADAIFFQGLRRRHTTEVREAVTKGDPCEECGQPVCAMCEHCHACIGGYAVGKDHRTLN